MSWKDRDPQYYGNEEDGEPGHGYWIRASDWETKRQELLKRRSELFEVDTKVKAGEACWWPKHGWHTQNPKTIIED